MPTKASNRPLPKPVNRSQRSAGLFTGWKPATIGMLTAAAVVAIGRQCLDITSSTLSGWTALFFLAVFFGLITADRMSPRSFVSPLQTITMVSGAVSSLTTLFLLHLSPTAASTTSLGIASVMFVLTMIMGFQYRSPRPNTFGDKSLEHWAIRLDDLLKYDLDRETKAQLVTLIEALWNSPKDQENYIPAQSQFFEESLTLLENSVRSQNLISIETNLGNLARCLDERNQLIQMAVKVSYRKVDSDTAMLPDKSSQP